MYKEKNNTAHTVCVVVFFFIRR